MPAQRAVVGAAHGDVSMHNRLTLLATADVPAQVQHLHLLLHHLVAINVGSGVEAAQCDLLKSTDGTEFSEPNSILVGETLEALDNLVTRLKQD